MIARWAALVFLALAIVAFAADDSDNDPDGDLDASFERDVLVIVANRYACYRFDIYLALESPQMARGLMHVRDLPATSGMLFVYDRQDYRSMWMKNTYIPLDIAFAESDGVIVNIARNTEPLSLKSIRSARPAMYVLELNAGVSKRLSIDTGSRLLWGPIFDQPL